MLCWCVELKPPASGQPRLGWGLDKVFGGIKNFSFLLRLKSFFDSDSSNTQACPRRLQCSLACGGLGRRISADLAVALGARYGVGRSFVNHWMRVLAA